MTSISRRSAFISATERIRPARTEPWQAMVAATWSSLSRRLSGPPSSAISRGEVGEQARDVGLAERGGHRADQHRRRAEALDFEAELGEFGSGAFEPVAIGLVELDDFGDQQRLAGDGAAFARGAHALEHQPLVRGVLVDDDQAVLGLGDDIGRRDLAAGDAEREARDRLDGGFGACGGRSVEEALRLPQRSSLPRKREPSFLVRSRHPRFRGDDERGCS